MWRTVAIDEALCTTVTTAFGCDVEIVLGPARDDTADAVLRYREPGPSRGLRREVKATVTPATVTGLGAQARRRLILFTPRLTPAVTDACRHLGVS